MAVHICVTLSFGSFFFCFRRLKKSDLCFVCHSKNHFTCDLICPLHFLFFFFFFFLHLHILFSNVFSRAVEKFNKKIPRRKVAHVQFSLYQMLNPPKYTVNSTLQGVASLSFLIASLLDQMLSRLSTPSSKTKETFC